MTEIILTHKTIKDVNQIAEDRGVVEKGDFIINLNSTPVKKKGMVNTMKISKV